MKFQLRNLRALTLLALGIMMTVVFIPRNTVSATGTAVTGTDFQAQSFSKVVDWYDYVRAYAQQNGFNATAIQNEHAYIYANYINVGGFQLFYAGLVNATHNGQFVTIPLQTFFEHFKTPGGKDAITASSFISLVAFNESSTGDLYPNSPDRTDTVYASFSLGVNLAALPGHGPYAATSSIIPLASTDSNHWTWGLNYTNLNAIWWKINPDPLATIFNQWDANVPRGFAQYSQLTFNYALAIDPNAKTATLTTSYTVGRVTDLYLLTTHPAIHLNSTGTYNLNGSMNNTQTVNQFLQARQMKLSIVLSQKTVLATPVTDKDTTGASVDNDNSTDVTHSAVTTTSQGENIAKSDFGVKPTYNLYNSTSGQSAQYNVNTRTVSRPAWAGNPVFWFQNTFMGFLPLFVAHVDPGLLQAAKAGMASFSVSDYLYIISYPTWGGYQITHDPQYQAFYQPSSNLGLLTAIFIAIAVAAGIGGVFAFIFRRRRAASMAMPASPTQMPPTPPPSPPSGPPGPTQ